MDYLCVDIKNYPLRAHGPLVRRLRAVIHGKEIAGVEVLSTRFAHTANLPINDFIAFLPGPSAQ